MLDLVLRYRVPKRIHRFLIAKLRQYKFRNSYWEFAKSVRDKDRFALSWQDRWPCLTDNTAKTFFDRQYVYHTAWAARIINKTNPGKHIDISSSLYFCSVVSAFVPVEFYDFRPAALVLSGLKTARADLTHLHFADNSVASLSCMHTVEHVGLGRYGDPMDYDGDLKAMAELARVLAHDGNFLFVVPIGDKPIIQFNAHRIYTKDQILDQFTGLQLRLKEFSLIPQNDADGGLVLNPSLQLLNKQKYACGCFWFTKKSA
jgi:SAM-dependent methyltransferase